jgi:transcriptional regulator with XRE-family HTH domain
MENADLKKLGKNIRDLREKTGFSQMKFAEHLEVHLNTVSLMERGKVNVPTLQLIKAARVLECKVTEFFKGI